MVNIHGTPVRDTQLILGQTCTSVYSAMKDINSIVLEIYLLYDYILNLFNGTSKSLYVVSKLTFFVKSKPFHVLWDLVECFCRVAMEYYST